MKKFLIILGVAFSIIVTAIIALPVIFKDDIRKALDDTMTENLNANVYYDIDAFNLSLIKNFPDITVSIGDFGIVGMDEFANDTLASIGTFLVTVDLVSVIAGDQIIVEEILLDQPKIIVRVLPNGKANYAIAKESEPLAPANQEKTTQGEKASLEEEAVKVGIEKWSIRNGKVTYIDQSINFFTTIAGVNHEGSGDFSLDIFDLKTKTTVDAISLGYEGTEYISNKSLALDAVLNMNLSEMKFTFKENKIAVNNFVMQANGYVSMPADNIDMNIAFGGKDIGLTSILSLIPGVYQEYLNGVVADGEIGFEGYVRGTFNETSMPEVAASLSVLNGRISYADFNIPIEKINIQSSFSYPSEDLSRASFNVDHFSMLVDGESVEAYLKLINLIDYNWDLGFDGNADLEKITKILPLENIQLRGKINAKLKTSGKMSDLEAERYNQLPTSGSVAINEFYFQSPELPRGFSIEQASLNFNPSEINLLEFNAKSGNSDFTLDGKLSNYLAYLLAEDERLIGQLSFNSSYLDLNELMPEERIEEEANEIEVGTIDPNKTSDEEIQTAIKVPENIDFTLNSSIHKIAYTNLSIDDFQGRVLIKDGSIILDQNRFRLLDGTFKITGTYITKGLEKPKYDLEFKVKDLSIGKAFDAFETIKSYAPIAKQVSGKFSSDFKVNGLLGDDMMPIMEAINLTGLVSVAEGAVEKGDFLQKLSSVTSFKTGSNASSAKNITVKDVLISTYIQNGRMYVEPFELEVSGQKAVVGGNNGLDGSLDYSMLLKDLSTGKVGNVLNSALSSLTGGKTTIANKINLTIGIGGTYDNPKIKLLGTSDASDDHSGSSTTAQFKEQLKEKVDEQKEKVEAAITKEKEEAKAALEKEKEEQRQKILSQAEVQANELRSQGLASAKKIREDSKAAAEKLIAEAGSNPIKKKLAEEAAKKLKAEADQKAAKVEEEANKQADKVLEEARKKATQI